MNKEAYIRELQQRLSGLNRQEIEDAITYCEEYFEEAESEQKAMEDLGSPAKFAAQIKAEAAIKNTNQNEHRRPRSGMRSIWSILLGICALPFALPLVLTAIILVVTLVIVMVAILLSMVIGVISFFIFSIPNLFISLFSFSIGQASFISLGVSLLGLGGALLCIILAYYLIQKLIPLCIRCISRLYEKAKGGKHHEESAY